MPHPNTLKAKKKTTPFYFVTGKLLDVKEAAHTQFNSTKKNQEKTRNCTYAQSLIHTDTPTLMAPSEHREI